MATFKNLDITALPEGWDAGHFGELVDYALGRTPPRNDASFWKEGVYPWVSISDMKPHAVVSETAEKVTEKAYAEVFRGQLVPEGSLLMSFKLTIGRVSRLGMPALHNEAIISFRPEADRVNEDYLAYYLSQINYKDYQDTAIKGQTLNKGKIDSLEIALPPLPEQQRIAQVLSTVQAAIEQQERLIRTTTELKQALMQKLFTEGLRGEAQKETEIGLVPESWAFRRADEVFAVVTDGTHDTPDKVENGRPLITSKALRAGKVDLNLASYEISEADFEEIARRSRVDRGDVLFSMIGTVGEVALVDTEPDYAIKNVGLFKTLNATDSVYSFFYFQTPGAQQYIKENLAGTSQKYMTLSKLRAFPIYLPSRDEAKQICEAASVIGSKLEAHKRKRTTLQDLFRTLLHELMTGKVRIA